jgi:ribosomal protein L7/L12
MLQLPIAITRSLPADIERDKIQASVLFKTGLQSGLGQTLMLNYSDRLLVFTRDYRSESFEQLALDGKDPFDLEREGLRDVLVLHTSEGTSHTIRLSFLDKHNLDRFFKPETATVIRSPQAALLEPIDLPQVDPSLLQIPSECLEMPSGLMEMPSGLMDMPSGLMDMPEQEPKPPVPVETKTALPEPPPLPAEPPRPEPASKVQPEASRGKYKTKEAYKPPEKYESPEESEVELQALRLLRKGKRILAIKLLVQELGLSIPEAKGFVEALAAKHGVQAPVSKPPPNAKQKKRRKRKKKKPGFADQAEDFFEQPDNTTLERQILALLEVQEVSKAIAIYQKAKGATSVVARHAIEAIAKKHGLDLDKKGTSFLTWIFIAGICAVIYYFFTQ